MTVYKLIRNDWQVSVITDAGITLSLRHDVLVIGPAFGWGKDNCKTAQLALALLLDAQVDKERALKLYSLYAKEVLSTFSIFHKEIIITSESILSWMRVKEVELYSKVKEEIK